MHVKMTYTITSENLPEIVTDFCTTSFVKI